MLPRSARLTAPEDFSRTTKSGFRVSTKSLVGYLYQTENQLPPKCGLIISKSVSGSVGRHKLARQLRHRLRNELINIPNGSFVVIRALPAAATTPVIKDLEKVISLLTEKTKNKV